MLWTTDQMISQASAALWALVPGFNVTASTKKFGTAYKSDASSTWKLMTDGILSNGPYILVGLAWRPRGTPTPNDGVDLKVTVDDQQVLFREFDERPDPDLRENVLFTPIFAENTLKVEMRKASGFAGTQDARIWYMRLEAP
jgi:hypothetical protein